MNKFLRIMSVSLLLSGLPMQGMGKITSFFKPTPSASEKQWYAALETYHTLFNTSVSLKQAKNNYLTPTLAHLYITRAYIDQYVKCEKLKKLVQEIIEQEIACLDDEEHYYSY